MLSFPRVRKAKFAVVLFIVTRRWETPTKGNGCSPPVQHRGWWGAPRYVDPVLPSRNPSLLRGLDYPIQGSSGSLLASIVAMLLPVALWLLHATLAFAMLTLAVFAIGIVLLSNFNAEFRFLDTL